MSSGPPDSLHVRMRPVRFPSESPEHRRARVLDKRVADLRGSRERIIAAADAERRRIERDLHDGAQQRMVAVAVTLGLAQAQMRSDPEAAAELIAQARDEAQLAVKELRELARGIHPAVLSDRGLAAALEALATRAPVPVEITGVPEEPLPQPVEAAVYFVTAEALTNIAKYAQADGASVDLAVDDDRVRLQISDDGVGGADTATGTGLSGLCDRVEALEGTFAIESPPGGGTAVTVEIPLKQ
jgi:signal transduction histidine kinase